MRHIPRFLIAGFGTEIIYSFVIILCSLIIYFGTRELYELTKHKGIKYFRQSFLFFAIAYVFRSLIKFVIVFFNIRNLKDFSPLLGPLTLVLFIYFSTMAVFYLLYSVMSKKWENYPKFIYFFHFIAIIVAIMIVITQSLQIYLTINFLLLFFVFYLVFVSYKESYSQEKTNQKKKSHNMYVIYLLLSVFWIFNILDILIPDAIQSYQVAVYIFSISIFMTILYKVIKKTS